MTRVIEITGSDLRLGDVARVLSDPEVEIRFPGAVMERVRRAREVVERAARGKEPVYGVNTGFGKLADVRIPREKLAELQRNLLMSHAAGVGEPLEPETVRIMMLLRINALAKGHSGIRPELLEALAALFNRGVVPVVPRKGSVGASGDLAPLAHAALVVIGSGEAYYQGRRMSGAAALRRAGLRPVELGPKEGLALINGTQMMTAVAARTLLGAYNLVRHADLAAAMSLEALKGTNTAFDARIQAVRPHPHQAVCADNLRRLLAGSWILASHVDCGKVQDAYSLRCAPQVHGAVRAALAHVEEILHVEMNAANDNPLIFPEEGEILSGGNFHGQPVALAVDYMALALAQLAAVSERRIENLVNPALSGLPAFLARREGLDSGFMIVQVTAAALVSENKVLAHPASADSIPTSANKEDHVSMGAHGALKAEQVLRNAEYVVALEILCAAQGLHFRGTLEPGAGVEAARRAFRRSLPPQDGDRFMHRDMERARKLLLSGRLIRAAERKVGRIA